MTNQRIILPDRPTLIIGIDPGKQGGIGYVLYHKLQNARTNKIGISCIKRNVIKLGETIYDTRQRIRAIIVDSQTPDDVVCYLECSNGVPNTGNRQRGMSSTATFFRGIGRLEGLLCGMDVTVHPVTPQKWMKRLDCLTGGDKSVTRLAAQRRWPTKEIYNWNADALLITHYGELDYLGVK